ncbi:hypothetical protein CesoFtcFv8_025034 [Champsocephalus esox]|uniref:Uncharacterized protein n=1 Tax=Champsocephalus esox TaxID=159716 RepID=A0AAN8GFP0_9TELE|nr:hypothetical protein CesoFtcFv8_025034 [Champsocephalus esox]
MTMTQRSYIPPLSSFLPPPAWLSHVKCGPRVSEDMPSATWAPANSIEPRVEQLEREYRCGGEEREG